MMTRGADRTVMMAKSCYNPEAAVRLYATSNPNRLSKSDLICGFQVATDGTPIHPTVPLDPSFSKRASSLMNLPD